jgi:enoyl-CoA hydratase/carnithine racemase
MTAYTHIDTKKSDGIARITFARPKHNVLDIEMMTEFNAELVCRRGGRRSQAG